MAQTGQKSHRRDGLRLRPWTGFVAVAIALALNGCGSDDGNRTSAASPAAVDEQGQIVDAVEGGFTSDDPAGCTKFSTQHYLERATGLKGQNAIRACKRLVSVDPADSVEVSQVSVHGDNASAEVAVSGSPFDGQVLALKLVMEGGRWKMDQLTDFVSFNREALNAGLSESYRRLGIPPEVRNCVISWFRRLSDDEAQRLYLSGNPSQIQRIIYGCVREERSRAIS